MGIRTESRSFTEVRRELAQGAFAVPKLQREFVWNPPKVCKLLDSMYRGYPIGNLMIWETPRRNAGLLRTSVSLLPPFDSRNHAAIKFIIDGQQRLTVLHQISNALDFHGDIDFRRVFFDPDAEPDADVFAYRSLRSAGGLISAFDLLSLRWRQHATHLGERRLRRVQRCRQLLLDYRLLFTVIDDFTLDEVRDTFIRINSQGMRIAAADVAFARAAESGLRELIRDARSELTNGFEEVGNECLLQAVAFAMDEHDVGGIVFDRVARKIERDGDYRARFLKLWPHLSLGFRLAVDFVETFGVRGYGDLPSDYLLTMLSLYFFYSDSTRPRGSVRRQIERWFWVAVTSTRYTGPGYRANLLADAEFVRRLGESRRANLSNVELQPLSMLKHTDYSHGGMLVDGYFCLLRLRGPRYFEDGEPVPAGVVSASGNRSDRHHIYPKALLRDHGVPERLRNSLCNVCYVVARENQSIGRRDPRDYLETAPDGIAGSRRILFRSLDSHLIPREILKWNGSVRHEYKTFLDARALFIAREFEARAGARLFSREL